MGARAAGVVQHAAHADADKFILNRHHHVTAMAIRMNPAEIVQHPPVDMLQRWNAEVAVPSLGKCGSDLACADCLQDECPVWPGPQFTRDARQFHGAAAVHAGREWGIVRSCIFLRENTMSELPQSGLQLQSKITSEGKLELNLVDEPVAAPKADEVVVRVEASPINPSDLGLLIGMADLATAAQSGTDERPEVVADVPDGLLKHMAGRLDEAMPVGNEGSGVVIAAGESDAAQALKGKTVAVLGGAMYSQYRTLKVHQCLPMHDGVAPKECASCFVNPLTALGMVETMRMEGFDALIHTAAASNLGQMLQKICLADGVQLVNIVRKEEQAQLLRDIGATYVCNSSDADFTRQLTDAIAATGAYLAFDATGGGELASQILTCMEAAAVATASEYSRYGSTQHKQVYIYGGLDRNPTVLRRSFGMSWGLGGWLLTPFLQKIGRERSEALRQRVADEVRTTFHSSYAAEISLAEALQLDNLRTYAKQATGQKYLINPNA